MGFQTEGDAQNFVRYLIAECNQMRDMRVFEAEGHQITVSMQGRQTLIGTFPVGIEPHAFARLAPTKMTKMDFEIVSNNRRLTGVDTHPSGDLVARIHDDAVAGL